MRLLARILRSMAPPAPAPSGGELEELQRRVAALEHAVDQERRQHRALLFVLGGQRGIVADRVRRDWQVAMAREGFDPVPITLLDPFEDGLLRWQSDNRVASSQRRGR